MYQIYNLVNNDDVKIIKEKGAYQVIEYQKDLSVTPKNAMIAYYCSEMNIRKRQLLCDLNVSDVTIQPGAMQLMVGNVGATTGVKGVMDFGKKMFRGAVTNESAIKPEYTGDGELLLEPTYRHIVLLDLDEWNGSVVLDDGTFMACDGHLEQKLISRSNLSSAMLGNEGLFNLGIRGSGVVCLECPCPEEELIEIQLRDDTLKIDGNMAVAWSSTLDFTVEKAGRSLVGSAVSGEGLVNVYRGTGKVLIAPVNNSIMELFNPVKPVGDKSINQ